ncbi:uncharacterized protein LOC133734539 [Rosa rugosa]|uniref:uncharacterized protein LOC133734539 n=1 Tax=Rosa rugosa TaxID=74645 RepID=UPI002B4004C2|nr:uncharacterized protein LOC133734539 [Rosa rugosa]
MVDLRPIALCNVIYKICSKAIANRLKIILPSIISPFQSVFVPGRLITDNILVANGVAHFVHNKREGPEGVMALKLDLSKAYDKMEWFFLRKVMERFGFTRVWIELVMQCVCSVRFSFLIRGKPRGYVSPSRGLRQGDPLSPYLFLIGVAGFSALLQKKQELGLLPGIEVCNDAPAVNHLLFADDSMLYAQASLEACYEIQDVIETYGRASGQLVNFNKSYVVFSKNVPLELQEEVTSLLGVEVVESHERYLGLPTYVGRKKMATFQYIKDNLAKKLKGWQGKMLSCAGKDILIRVVAQALPTYAMSAFQLTKNFCEDLEQMCARFWWGSTEDKRKIHWKAWDALCLPKEEEGLGFRSLTEFNLAMLAKQAWRIISDPASLIARVYKAKYFSEGSFWSATAHTAPSYSWRSIFATRELLKSGSYWQIGSGTKVKVWSDAWVPGLPNFVPHAAQIQVNDNLSVNELMRAQGVWHEERVRALFNGAEVEAILAMPLSTRPVDDRLVWKLESRGNFTVKTAYHFAYSNSIERANVLGNVTACFWKKICNAKIPNTAKSVWKERNCRVWDRKTKNASDVVLLATSRLQDYVFHNQKRMVVARPSETVTKWKCPPSDCVKINVDGAFNSQTKTGGTGLVFRDATGHLLTGIGRPLVGLLSAEHAELLACKCAVKFIMEQVTQPVILETDSLVVQQHLTTAGDANSSLLGRVYEDLLVQLADLPNVRITHVNRKGNMAAHLVAAQASTLGVSMDFNHVPSFLTAVIAAELCTS